MSKSDPQYTLLDRFLDQPYSLAGRVIDPVSGTLSWQGKREHLRRKELEVLALLASAEGKQVSRENFIAVVWQGNDLVGDRGLTNTLFFLRRSLGDESQQPLIRTIPRRGYQLTAAVKFLAASDQQAIAEVQPQPVESLLAPGGTVADCPGWRLVRRLEQSPESESWLAEPSEFGELDQGLRVFRFCRSEAQLQRLRREVTLLRYLTQTLSDRGDIVLIRDWQLEEPPYYLLCDYANAGSLYDFIRTGGLPNDPEKRLVLMRALAEALAAVHEHGVVHRQLSAQTVLVDQRDTGAHLLLSAFDLGALSDRTKLVPLNITAAGLTMESEALSAESATAADVCALGGVLLQLALADAQALPNAQFLERIADAKLRALIDKCSDASLTRPSAQDVALALARMALPESQTDQSMASESEVPATALHKATPPSQLAPTSMPESIASYRLLDRLGEGGMGAVYLAEQHEPYRKVALKIIRSGLDGKQILSRFEAERQALALMNHPNVTTVLDSGLAADGKPYFAMEYVQGQEITAYCDAHHLNIHARIKLFLQVCDGVLHAHQKGVLHRDIKPSNLMVSSAPDNAGTVKIIDFGLAKSLHGKLAANTLHTSFGAFIGTPVYSSPEHVSGSAAGVDTRSDIYSMGVVLYELLAGMTPIANESLANLEPEKIREIVCKSKLPTMREQLQNTSEEKRKALAEHRAIKVDELPKTLEGDLSWVVGKCLERDPNDRYASVLALKEDLQRWLELRPVEARPTSRWYRIRKFVRRNRTLSAMTLASLAIILLSTTAAFYAYLKAERERQAADDARLEAQSAAEFQVKQMQALDPAAMGAGLRNSLIETLRTQGANTGQDRATIAAKKQQFESLTKDLNLTDVALELLNDYNLKPALRVIDTDYADQPLLQARLWQSVADIYSSLGKNKAALAPQTRALETRQKLLGSGHRLTIESLVNRSRIHNRLKEFSLAEADLRAALALARQNFGEDDRLSMTVTEGLAVTLGENNQYQEAEAMLRGLLASRTNLLGKEHPDTAASLNNLAWTLLSAGKASEALPHAVESLRLQRDVIKDKQGLSLVLNTLAMSYRDVGKLKQSEALMRELMELDHQRLGSAHPTTLIDANNLTMVLMDQGKHAQAASLIAHAIENAKTELVETDPIFEILKGTQASLLSNLGRLAEAENVFDDVIAIRKQNNSENHSSYVFARADLAKVLMRQGRYEEASAMFAQVLEWVQANFGADHEISAMLMQDLAWCLVEQQQLARAAQLLGQALKIHRKNAGDVDEKTLAVAVDIAGLQERRGDLQGAETLLRKIIEIQQKKQPKSPDARLYVLEQFVPLLRMRGKLEEAALLGQELVESCQIFYDAKHYQIGVCLTSQAQTLTALRRYDEAEKLLDRARVNLAQGYNPNPKPVVELAQAYIALYNAWGNADRAALWRKTLKAVESAEFGAAAEVLR